MSLRRSARSALAASLLALCAGAPFAHASPGMEVGMADDRILLETPDRAAEFVNQWKSLGVDIVRIHVRWVKISPNPDSPLEPSKFRAEDHNDPLYNWGAIDRGVNLVRQAGMSVMLAVTGSGPLWASGDPSRDNSRYRPSPAKFAEFATAVAHRYGSLVDRYLIWNEPNQPGWLQPQFNCDNGPCVPESPHIYRGLVRASVPAIKRADPGAQVMMGTLAPRGGDPKRRNVPMRPLTFIRAMGCVDERYRPIRSGSCRDFVPAAADGFSYHPHGVLRGPDEPNPKPDEAAIADLPRLEDVLDRTTLAGGFRPSTGLFNLYLTEFGYQTNPPDPYQGVSFERQARWLQQAGYVTWRDPRVRNVTQYAWRDEPVLERGLGSKAFTGWQSGLLTAGNHAKPAFNAWVNPFYVDVRPGRTLARFWGQVRPGGAHTVTLLRRRAGTRRFFGAATIRTDKRGFWDRRVPVREQSHWRFVYDLPSDSAGESPVRFRSSVVSVRPIVATTAKRGSR